jgi:hypothetical protein
VRLHLVETSSGKIAALATRAEVAAAIAAKRKRRGEVVTARQSPEHVAQLLIGGGSERVVLREELQSTAISRREDSRQTKLFE